MIACNSCSHKGDAMNMSWVIPWRNNMFIGGSVVKHQNNLNKQCSWHDAVSNHISWMYTSQSQQDCNRQFNWYCKTRRKLKLQTNSCIIIHRRIVHQNIYKKIFQIRLKNVNYKIQMYLSFSLTKYNIFDWKLKLWISALKSCKNHWKRCNW